ncbi:MAG: hypothetical protein IKO72_14700 [Kiritimatiellae bacterium]|nr:hypothetical protein [Kiritimatiellia bacterium]
MKSIMTIAAVAICGLTVLVAGCSEETEAQRAEKNLKAAVGNAGKAADKAAADAKKAGEKVAADAKKAADAAKK